MRRSILFPHSVVLAVFVLPLVLPLLLPGPLRAAEVRAPVQREVRAPVQTKVRPRLPSAAALDLAVLRAAYPGEFRGMVRDAAGRLDLVLSDGSRLLYDDGRTRTPAEALEHPDVRAMLAQVYPLGPLTPATARPKPAFDPGRDRSEAFFETLYGASRAAVLANCRPVRFDGREVPFQRRFGAARALARVWQHIRTQLPLHPGWAAVLGPLGGTFCWRDIAGTDRLSIHSFGAAIDLNPHLPYWRSFRRPEAAARRRLAFPQAIVAAFEAQGFIWGGKWAHFDLMHFEYRPALILKAHLLRGDPPAALGLPGLLSPRRP